MKRLLPARWLGRIVLALVVIPPAAQGQLRIVSYNTTPAISDALLDVLIAIGQETRNGIARPIDVLAVQEQPSLADQTQAIVEQLNGYYGAGTYARSQRAGQGSLTQAFIYRTQTVRLVDEVAVGRVSSDGAPRQTMRAQLRPVGYGPAADWYVYNSHLKAGNSASDAARRGVEAAAIRRDATAFQLHATRDALLQDGQSTSLTVRWTDSTASGIVRRSWEIPTADEPLPGAAAGQTLRLNVVGLALTPAAGDFDGDDQLTLTDLLSLQRAIRQPLFNGRYDLNRDGQIGLDDLQLWVSRIRRTAWGDANLDGRFDSSDLVGAFAMGEYEDQLAGNSDWATGDWNTDGEFSSSDLVWAFQQAGYQTSAGGLLRMVPEPNGPCRLVLLGISLSAVARRKRR